MQDLLRRELYVHRKNNGADGTASQESNRPENLGKQNGSVPSYALSVHRKRQQQQKKVLSDLVKYGYISDIKKNEIISETENYRNYFENKKNDNKTQTEVMNE